MSQGQTKYLSSDLRLSEMSSTSSSVIGSPNEEDEDGHPAPHPTQESRIGDLFNLTLKFGLRKHSELELHTKYSIGRLSHCAFTLKQ